MSFAGNGVSVAGSEVVRECVPARQHGTRRRPLVGAYVSLLLFIVIYCARPEDWISGLAVVPIAKIAGGLAC
jgi:hypothetical protein